MNKEKWNFGLSLQSTKWTKKKKNPFTTERRMTSSRNCNINLQPNPNVVSLKWLWLVRAERSKEWPTWFHFHKLITFQKKKKKKLVQILLVGKLKELHLQIAVIFTYSKNRWIEVRSKLQVRLFYSTN